MGHTPETRRRAYEKMQARRTEWFEANGPCQKCGSWDKLELDHINPADKEHHAVWSWSEQRMYKELAKCQVLCQDCHIDKSLAERGQKRATHGVTTMYRNGCRCEACKAAEAADSRARYLRNKLTRSGAVVSPFLS